MSDTEVNNMESYGDEPRTRLFSERRSEEGYMAEKMHNLFRRRVGHISVLTKIYNEISVTRLRTITCGKCNVGDILLRLNKFDKAWCEFVDVHEQYLGLVQNETDKQNACASHEEQSKRKTKLDALTTEWRPSAKIKSHSETGSRSAKSKHSKSMRSRSGSSNSKASSISKKREEMALARLKVEQLRIRQQFDEIQEQEIKRKKELANAEMEANMATVSYEIYRAEEGSISGNEERDEYFRESAFKEMKEFREPVLTRNEGNKPIFSVEMETIKKVPEVGESQYRAFRELGKNENLTSVELPAQYCEQSSSHDRVAPDSKDVRI